MLLARRLGKVGGEGINLTNANHTIFFNRWWNPSNNNQAQDRIHRLGQEKESFTHIPITMNTIEDKISEILRNKKVNQEPARKHKKFLTQAETCNFLISAFGCNHNHDDNNNNNNNGRRAGGRSAAAVGGRAERAERPRGPR